MPLFLFVVGPVILSLSKDRAEALSYAYSCKKWVYMVYIFYG